LNRLPRTRCNILSLYFISVSLVGLFLLAPLTFSVPTLKLCFSWQKPVVALIFGLICLLGIIAGVYPSKCSQMLHFQKNFHSMNTHNAERVSVGEGAITFEGHHPNCGNFSAHVFQFGGKMHCAGCTGLVMGAIVSLCGTLVLFFAESLFREIGIVLFWLGFLGVALGLLQYNLFHLCRSSIHLFLNVIFVLGAFLLLVGIEELASNLVLDVYLLTLTLYWILTRMLLSQLEHRKICVACGLESCRFLE